MLADARMAMTTAILVQFSQRPKIPLDAWRQAGPVVGIRLLDRFGLRGIEGNCPRDASESGAVGHHERQLADHLARVPRRDYLLSLRG